jgi:hypothetical protein
LLAIVAAAVALKVAAIAPAATVTDGGTVSEGLLLASARLRPPAGAAWVNVTVQALTPLGPRLVGLHAKLEMRAGATRLMTAACELLPRLAVTVAL